MSDASVVDHQSNFSYEDVDILKRSYCASPKGVSLPNLNLCFQFTFR